MATRSLYRAISTGEHADVLACGHFRPGPNSCEGKHFATTATDARQWGDILFDGSFVVLSCEVSESELIGWAYWAKLDGIGPAYFADTEQLKACKQIRVHEA